MKKISLLGFVLVSLIITVGCKTKGGLGPDQLQLMSLSPDGPYESGQEVSAILNSECNDCQLRVVFPSQENPEVTDHKDAKIFLDTSVPDSQNKQYTTVKLPDCAVPEGCSYEVLICRPNESSNCIPVEGSQTLTISVEYTASGCSSNDECPVATPNCIDGICTEQQPTCGAGQLYDPQSKRCGDCVKNEDCLTFGDKYTCQKNFCMAPASAQEGDKCTTDTNCSVCQICKSNRCEDKSADKILKLNVPNRTYYSELGKAFTVNNGIEAQGGSGFYKWDVIYEGNHLETYSSSDTSKISFTYKPTKKTSSDIQVTVEDGCTNKEPIIKKIKAIYKNPDDPIADSQYSGATFAVFARDANNNLVRWYYPEANTWSASQVVDPITKISGDPYAIYNAENGNTEVFAKCDGNYYCHWYWSKTDKKWYKQKWTDKEFLTDPTAVYDSNSNNWCVFGYEAGSENALFYKCWKENTFWTEFQHEFPWNNAGLDPTLAPVPFFDPTNGMNFTLRDSHSKCLYDVNLNDPMKYVGVSFLGGSSCVNLVGNPLHEPYIDKDGVRHYYVVMKDASGSIYQADSYKINPSWGYEVMNYFGDWKDLKKLSIIKNSLSYEVKIIGILNNDTLELVRYCSDACEADEPIIISQNLALKGYPTAIKIKDGFIDVFVKQNSNNQLLRFYSNDNGVNWKQDGAFKSTAISSSPFVMVLQ